VPWDFLTMPSFSRWFFVNVFVRHGGKPMIKIDENIRWNPLLKGFGTPPVTHVPNMDGFWERYGPWDSLAMPADIPQMSLSAPVENDVKNRQKYPLGSPTRALSGAIGPVSNGWFYGWFLEDVWAVRFSSHAQISSLIFHEWYVWSDWEEQYNHCEMTLMYIQWCDFLLLQLLMVPSLFPSTPTFSSAVPKLSLIFSP
jgi:hypothetical protein